MTASRKTPAQSSSRLTRVTIQVREQDAPLLRSVTEALADPARAAQARSFLQSLVANPSPTIDGNNLLASAPEGVDFDQPRQADPHRPIFP